MDAGKDYYKQIAEREKIRRQEQMTNADYGNQKPT